MKKILLILFVLISTISFAQNSILLRSNRVNQIAGSDTSQIYITPSTTYWNSTNPVTLNNNFTTSKILTVNGNSILGDTYQDTTKLSGRIGINSSKYYSNLSIVNSSNGSSLTEWQKDSGRVFNFRANNASGLTYALLTAKSSFNMTFTKTGKPILTYRDASGNIILGNDTLNAWKISSSLTANDAIGTSALNAITTGYGNTALGYKAGLVNTLGFHNTFIGDSAGITNLGNATGSLGSHNVFIGNQAGKSNTASNNTLIGDLAGTIISSGANNTAIGGSSLNSCTTSPNNTVIGYWAMSAGTGQQNTVMGSSALRFASSGNNQVAIGYSSMGLLTGSNNVAIGIYSLGSAAGVGFCNTAIGSYSGYSTTSGNRNVLLGDSTGYKLTSGNKNTFLGTYAGFNNILGTSNVFLGYSAGYNETLSNKLYVDNSTTTTPLIKGDFAGDSLTFYGTAAITGLFTFKNGINIGGVTITSIASIDTAAYTPKNTGNIVAATGITYAMLSASMYYNGGSAIDISANPQIITAGVTTGRRIQIIGTSDVNTLTLENGTGIACPATRVLGLNDVWAAEYNGTAWVELYFNNN